MTGYTKLFASILDSTIWRETDKTRIVWITMLAMSNQWGDVEASVPGLADRARVSVAEVEAALKVLAGPDEYSRSKEFEGRRIQEIDGGWRIVNHGKYREKMSQDQRREYLAQKQRERRARLKGVNTTSTVVNNVNSPSVDSNGASTLSTQAEADSEADTKAIAPLPKSPRGVVDGKRSDNVPTTDQSRRMATMFHRRHTTAWSAAEIRAYKAIGVVPEDDMVLLEGYYKSGAPYLRHDLGTFLNNFAGELDRARLWKKEQTDGRLNQTHQRRDNAVLNLPDRYA